MKLTGRVVRWGWRTAQRTGVVTAETAEGRRFAAFGPGSMLAFPPGSVFGEGSIVIGADVVVGEMVSLSAGLVPGQDLGPEPVLRIGDRCVIGRGTHVVAHQSVLIRGDRVVCALLDDALRREARCQTTGLLGPARAARTSDRKSATSSRRSLAR